MEHDPSKLWRGGNAVAASARVRPCGFPAYQKRNDFALTGSLLHQAKEIARCIDSCILHLLNHITRRDTLAERLGLVIDRHDRYSVRIPKGIALARSVGNRRQQHPEIWGLRRQLRIFSSKSCVA